MIPNSKEDIKKKDKGKQFTISVNPVTYVIMINSIINMGKDQGIDIERRDLTVDKKGQHIKAQFDVAITNHRVNVPITVTCLHTTTKLWIQLLGKSNEENWEEKKAILSSFVNTTMAEMIKKVENLECYATAKENETRAMP